MTKARLHDTDDHHHGKPRAAGTESSPPRRDDLHRDTAVPARSISASAGSPPAPSGQDDAEVEGGFGGDVVETGSFIIHDVDPGEEHQERATAAGFTTTATAAAPASVSPRIEVAVDAAVVEVAEGESSAPVTGSPSAQGIAGPVVDDQHQQQSTSSTTSPKKKHGSQRGGDDMRHTAAAGSSPTTAIGGEQPRRGPPRVTAPSSSVRRSHVDPSGLTPSGLDELV